MPSKDETRVVYVAGKIGEQPTAVCTSLERAMTAVLQVNSVNPKEAGLIDVTWQCEFLDGNPEFLSCVTQIQDESWYCVRFNVDEDEWPPDIAV